MKHFPFFIFVFIFNYTAWSQRNCGWDIRLNNLESQHKGIKKQIINDKLQNIAYINQIQNKNNPLAKSQFKTTVVDVKIPIVFHIVIDSSTYSIIGGQNGIERRIKSQLKVINESFKALNSDSVRIPTIWQSLFANTGIEFGLATKDPDGNITKGYTLTFVPYGTNFNANDGAKKMKSTTTGGYAPWDNTKYINIWVGSLKYGSSSILGVTIPQNELGYLKYEYGIALNTYAFGVRDTSGMMFINKIDKGKTLTHELGHFFGLIHTWGDDGGLCPSTGGDDDGINDTPEEADAIYGDPTFPQYDVCTPADNGVMFMNYMDYVNDSSMLLFTKEQSNVMQASVSPGGTCYSLTLNPYLIDSGHIPTASNDRIIVYPNPTNDRIYISSNTISPIPQSVQLFNIQGQKILNIEHPNTNIFSLQHLPKGLYMLHCQFGQELLIEKLIVE